MVMQTGTKGFHTFVLVFPSMSVIQSEAFNRHAGSRKRARPTLVGLPAAKRPPATFGREHERRLSGILLTILLSDHDG